MKDTFLGIKIGDKSSIVHKLEYERISRGGEGQIKHIKWKLKTNNELSITYDSRQNRILYMELDWLKNEGDKEVGIDNFMFGQTTLEDIRKSFNSNGFSHAEHMMFDLEGEIVTFNAFELENTASIIVVFVTSISLEDKALIDTRPHEQQVMGAIGKYFKLVGVVVSDENYLDEIWGHKKLYDPESRPIRLN